MGGAAMEPLVPGQPRRGRTAPVRKHLKRLGVSPYNTVTPLGWPLSFWKCSYPATFPSRRGPAMFAFRLCSKKLEPQWFRKLLSWEKRGHTALGLCLRVENVNKYQLWKSRWGPALYRLTGQPSLRVERRRHGIKKHFSIHYFGKIKLHQKPNFDPQQYHSDECFAPSCSSVWEVMLFSCNKSNTCSLQKTEDR